MKTLFFFSFLFPFQDSTDCDEGYYVSLTHPASIDVAGEKMVRDAE
jgi:hypothetical protein